MGITKPKLNVLDGGHSRLPEIFASYQFNFTNEDELQRAIEIVLTQENIAFVREVELSKASRIDFMLGSVGLEVKVGFSYSDVVFQLHRYAYFDEISELVLVTTRLQHTMPDEINGKKLTTIQLGLVTSL